jgi:hypothetical protein
VSFPKCTCKVKYDLAAKKAAHVEHCAFHQQAGELYEIVDSLVSLTEQKKHHKRCRCLHCRSVRAIEKAGPV